jgi:vancomycin permeability regulator SanA
LKISVIKHTTLKLFSYSRKYYSRRFLAIVSALGISVLLLALTVPFLVIQPNSRYITTLDSEVTSRVGIVFGAGITKDGKPFKELEARLDAAAAAIDSGQIKYILASGDNRFESYNEPDAMKQYLVDVKNIDASKIIPDYAGRSTYETCERAKKIFEVNSAILFSATSHLPRAIYTCRSFGVESYGIGNEIEANNATRRESLARAKAMFNIYIFGEKTILGDPIPITQ